MNSNRKSRTAIGSLIVLLGIALMLMNMGLIEHVHFWHFWPLILVVIGLGRLLDPGIGGDRWKGIWLILLGVWFQMVTLNIFGFTYGNSWPVLLIVWGMSLSIHALVGPPIMTFAKESSNGN